jgi:hypothetical protein
MMLRKLGILLVALLLAAVIADTLVWFWVVRQIRTGWENWASDQRAAGWTVSAGVPQAGGWPLAVAVTLPDVSLQGGKAAIPNGMAWSAQRLVLRLSVRRPHVLQIEAGGVQHVRVSDGPDIAYTAQRLRLLVPLPASPSALPLDLRAEALNAGLDGATDNAVTIASLAAHIVLHADAGSGQPAATLDMNANGVALPHGVGWALGEQIGLFRLDMALSGPLPATGRPAAAAAAWRDGGGTLTVRHVATQWGPLGLSAAGALHLDAQLQPAGNGHAEITGFGATLDALAQHGVIRRSAAVAATALLSLMAATPAGGGPPAVTVPLSLRDQVLLMQRIPLLRTPALDWSQP